jgi:hypothetical protein
MWSVGIVSAGKRRSLVRRAAAVVLASLVCASGCSDPTPGPRGDADSDGDAFVCEEASRAVWVTGSVPGDPVGDVHLRLYESDSTRCSETNTDEVVVTSPGFPLGDFWEAGAAFELEVNIGYVTTVPAIVVVADYEVDAEGTGQGAQVCGRAEVGDAPRSTVEEWEFGCLPL